MSRSDELDGPWFEDFERDMVIAPLPPVTLTEADNLAYRMITGDQHLSTADRTQYRAIAGSDGALVNPGLVMQYAIGQTTNATRRAIANLYYRAVRILRPVEVGETLSTTTTVLGLADARPKNGTHRGKVWLGIETTGAHGPAVRYERCALVACRAGSPGHGDDIPGASDPVPLAELGALAPTWDLTSLPVTVWSVDEEITDPMRDHIDLAPSLARMTFNQAFVHRDVTAGTHSGRLVYGGHVQGLAQASLTRVLPGLGTVVAWDGCDHVAPAFEGDLLEFRHRLLESHPIASGQLLRLEVRGIRVERDGESTELLRWTPIVFAP